MALLSQRESRTTRSQAPPKRVTLSAPAKRNVKVCNHCKRPGEEEHPEEQKEEARLQEQEEIYSTNELDRRTAGTAV